MAVLSISCRKRSTIPLMFIGLLLIHDILFSGLDSSSYNIYYLADAIIGVFMIVCVERLDGGNNLEAELSIVAGITILLNLMGWFLWSRYYSSQMYDISFIVLYLSVIALLIKGVPTSERSTGPDIKFNCFRLSHN